MKLKIQLICVLAATCLTSTSLAYADEIDKVHPTNAVKESELATAIKLSLSAGNSSSMSRVVIKADSKGVVVLSGSVATQELADKAETVARNTVGVNSVSNQLVVKSDF